METSKHLASQSRNDITLPTGLTESRHTVKVRRVQNFFRNTLLVGYNNRCALSGLDIPELLIASHIIPWSKSESRRADPSNGIILNSLCDKAFDRGFISFDESNRTLFSIQLKRQLKLNPRIKTLFSFEGQILELPERFHPDPMALKWHRNNVYKS